MADPQSLNSRLEYLDKAAHLLAISAPTISATLGTARDSLLGEQDVDLDMPSKDWRALRRDMCGACGSIMIPGWSCQVAHEVQLKSVKQGPKRRRHHTTERKDIDVVYTCLRCERKTTQPLERRTQRHMKKRSSQGPKTASIALPTREVAKDDRPSKPNPKTASSGSKQRAKARKGGLQAMLAQSKAQTSKQGGLGLDLMDFMQ
ncbi:hypothetical protein BU24DRAFT_405701 [Aaosphaeria arxii CBS 175.79]|uniref:Rpr2-domain-containing protein n=1 Tax=Aaosphaeria arxii CBS 175.79 TaxID=1450172 RepID=A0A6A5Y0B5_9PLEO|nr:uncharacterized protein BU24DRAFT_405701 [Aaosphaeria arxii CBS 175.79]KAF2018978.1 hypothetical protein BU24DRAFT_405701 [Aaosphaeria arxii CBS 175.79]